MTSRTGMSWLMRGTPRGKGPPQRGRGRVSLPRREEIAQRTMLRSTHGGWLGGAESLPFSGVGEEDP